MVESSKSPLLQTDDKDDSSKLSVHEATDASRMPSPMTSRNIQRVGDKKRIQAKYGWL